MDEPERNSMQTILIETPRGSFVKRNEHGDIDYVSPLPSPFHYGRLQGFQGGDGDPMDAIWFGATPVDNRATGRVVGVVHFVDGGQVDDKWVLTDQATLSAWQKRQLTYFFALYARLKNILVLLGNRAMNSHVRSIDLWIDVV